MAGRNPKLSAESRVELGQVIRRERLLLGWTQQDLADRIEVDKRVGKSVDKSAICHVESGKGRLGIARCRGLLDTLANELHEQGLKVPDRAKREQVVALLDDAIVRSSNRDAPSLTRRGVILGPIGYGIGRLVPLPAFDRNRGQERATPGEAHDEASRLSLLPPWEQLLASGDRLSAATRPAEAKQKYEAAAQVAPSGSHKALALGLAATAARRVGDRLAVMTLSAAALVELDLAAYSPEQMVYVDKIISRLQPDNTALRAYAAIARAKGHTFIDEEQYGAAYAALTKARSIGDKLRDNDIRADTTSLLGRVLLEQGQTVISDFRSETYWYTAVDKSKLRAAIRRFKEARVFRPDDASTSAFNWLLEARALRLLDGRDRSGVRAEHASQRAFGTNPARINLLAWQGHCDLVDLDKPGVAYEQIAEAIQIAIDISSDGHLARSYGSMSELYSEIPGGYESALSYAIGAMLVWPFSFDNRDYRRIEQTFRALEGLPSDIDRAVDAMPSPVAVAMQMPNFRVERIQQIKDRFTDGRNHSIEADRH